MGKSNEALTKRDALRWLEMQRDAINTEIAYAAPDDKRQYFGNLKVVNWLAERVNEMTAVEYLEVRKELCNSQACKNCPLSTHNTKHCAHMELRAPARAVEIVKKWKEEQDGNAHAEG